MPVSVSIKENINMKEILRVIKTMNWKRDLIKNHYHEETVPEVTQDMKCSECEKK